MPFVFEDAETPRKNKYIFEDENPKTEKYVFDDGFSDEGYTLGKTAKAGLNLAVLHPLRGIGDVVTGFGAAAKEEANLKALPLSIASGIPQETLVKYDPEAWIGKQVEKLGRWIKPDIKPAYEFGEGTQAGAFVEQGLGGVIESAPAMLAQRVNPGLGGVSIFAQLKGSKYDQLINEGIPEREAQIASDINALLGTPIEYLGNLVFTKGVGKSFAGLVEKTGIPSKLAKVISGLALSSLGEGGEEYTQAYTELIADEYAKNYDKSAGEITDKIIKKAGSSEFQKQAGLQAAMGAFGGLGLGAIELGGRSLQKRFGKDIFTPDELLSEIENDNTLTAENIMELKQNPHIQSLNIDDELNRVIIDKKASQPIIRPETTEISPAERSAQVFNEEFAKEEQLRQSQKGSELLKQQLEDQSKLEEEKKPTELIISPESAETLKGITVNIPAYDEESGKIVQIQENAHDALNEIKAKESILSELLRCVS